MLIILIWLIHSLIQIIKDVQEIQVWEIYKLKILHRVQAQVPLTEGTEELVEYQWKIQQIKVYASNTIQNHIILVKKLIMKDLGGQVVILINKRAEKEVELYGWNLQEQY